MVELSADMPLEKLERAQKIQLLVRLRKKLKSLVLSLEAPNAPIGAELPSTSEVCLQAIYPHPSLCSLDSLPMPSRQIFQLEHGIFMRNNKHKL